MARLSYSKRIGTAILMVIVVMITSAMPVSAQDEIKIRFPGRMVGTSGSTAYFSVGHNGYEGRLYKYNSSTKEKKLLAKGLWDSLNLKSNRLYLQWNMYGGSDGTNYYIYRMTTTGKKRKKLAKGFNPVVRGKYIYYIATEKTKRDGDVIDGKTKGIYRMKLNGTGKKQLVKGGGGYLGVTSKGLVYLKNGDWYTCDFKGKHRKKADIGNYSSNCSLYDDESPSWRYSSLIDVKCGSSKIFGYENKVRELKVTEDDVIVKDLASVNGLVRNIITSGGFMMIISSSDDDYKYYVYMIKKNGSSKKKVYDGVNAGIGWYGYY